MPQDPATNIIVEEELEEDDDYDADDFSFIIGSDGELKSIMIPGHLMDDPPSEVQLILKIFGINDIHQLEGRTLH
jgi:hypothetical protein